jgi:DNA helicase HerA-like ATPase
MVRQRVRAANSDSDISWRALLSKLWRLKNLKVFDNPAAPPLNFGDLLQPGRVNLIDLSDMESPQVRNIVIAHMLRGIQNQQDENYKGAVAEGSSPNPTMVFIEEAHEFLSAERIKQMGTLSSRLRALRGGEESGGSASGSFLSSRSTCRMKVLGLINNWILHKISDSTVVARLRKSVGGIDDSLWNRLPSLAQGQAITSFTSFARPIQTNIDPTPCKLLMIE